MPKSGTFLAFSRALWSTAKGSDLTVSCTVLLIFVLVAGMGLCFGFRMRIMWITH